MNTKAAAPAPAKKPANGAPEAPAEVKPAKEDLLLLLTERSGAIRKAEDAVQKVREHFAGKLSPYEGMIIRHEGELQKVVKARGGYTLRAMESAALKKAREENL